MAQERTIRINRAPVLTLWAAVVAERQFPASTPTPRASRLGYEPSSRAVDEHLQKAKAGTTLHFDLLHRAVPVVRTPAGLRALSNDRAISVVSVERYLEGKFGENLGSVRRAMVKLAHSMPPAETAARAYRLYEEFRPEIPAGVKGWGANGELDLDLIARLGA